MKNVDFKCHSLAAILYFTYDIFNVPLCRKAVYNNEGSEAMKVDCIQCHTGISAHDEVK